MSEQLRLAVAVPTYHRNDELREVVPLLLAQIDEVAGRGSAEILIVDNDAAGGARAVIDELDDERVRYVIEPIPGIAAARNRALDECADRDLLVFIDDDERPMPHWLVRLLDTRERFCADAVAGPVRSLYLGPLDPWIDAGGFFGRRHRLDLPSGTEVPDAATNNLLLDLRAVRSSEVRFATDVGLAGGEDSLFTRSLTRAGGRLVWCADAWVTELVPANRATRRWVLARQMSSGNGTARVRLRMAPNPRAALRVRAELMVGALARIGGGGARCAAGWLVRSLTHRARGTRTVSRGLGMLLGSFGYTYQAYRRTTS